MTAPSSIDPARFLHDQLESASPDLLRSMLATFINALMSAEADAICGAPYGMPGPDRVNVRDGYRHRDFDTRAGTLDTGTGTSIPVPGPWTWRSRSCARAATFRTGCWNAVAAPRAALTSVVATCYLLGVSTRRMEKLVESLGITRLSRSQGSLTSTGNSRAACPFPSGRHGFHPRAAMRVSSGAEADLVQLSKDKSLL
jgi:putative transposase